MIYIVIAQMATHKYQTFFYPVKNTYTDINVLLQELKQYIYMEKMPEPEPEPIIEAPKPKKYPNNVDALFWNIFQFCFGFEEHVTLNAEVKEKMKIIEWIKGDIGGFQASFEESGKITKIKCQEIMSTLLTLMKSNIVVMYAYSAYYKITFYMCFSNSTYFVISPKISEKSCYLQFNAQNKMWEVAQNAINLNGEYIKLRNYYDPFLFSESHYTKPELLEMYRIVFSGTEEPAQKKAIYGAIINHIENTIGL